jgi:hypothetical protein
MAHSEPVTVEVPVAVLRGLADEHMRKSIVINQLLMDAGVDITGVSRPAAPVVPATVTDLTIYRAARGA